MSFTDEGFASLLTSLNEPAWLTEQRKSAWNQFNQLPWPSNRDEEWMRTDIRMFKLDKFTLGGEPAGQESANVLAAGVDLAGSMTFKAGVATVDKPLDKSGSTKA